MRPAIKGSTIDVVVSSDTNDIANCGKSNSDGVTTIGGMAFSTAIRGDVGAGQVTSVTSYEILHENMCWKIAKTENGTALSHYLEQNLKLKKLYKPKYQTH